MSKKFALPMPTDYDLAVEAKEYLDLYVAKAEELRKRGIIIQFSLANGADGNEVKLAMMQVNKSITLPGAPVQDKPKAI